MTRAIPSAEYQSVCTESLYHSATQYRIITVLETLYSITVTVFFSLRSQILTCLRGPAAEQLAGVPASLEAASLRSCAAETAQNETST